MGNAPVVSLLAVPGDVAEVTSRIPLCALLDHACIEGRVELEVVTVGCVGVSNGFVPQEQSVSELTGEVVVPRQRRISFELVVTVQPQFWAEAGRGSSVGSIAADGVLHRDWVAVEADTKSRQQDCEIVADTVDILLCADELVKCRDAVTGEEVVVRRCFGG